MSSAGDDDSSHQAPEPTPAQAESVPAGEGVHRGPTAAGSLGNHSRRAEHEVDSRESSKVVRIASLPRPSLLAISTAAGKAASTSSTSVTTVRRIQRSISNLSIATGPSIRSSTDKHGSKDLSFSADQRSPPVDVSPPPSPTSSLQAAHSSPRTARSLANEERDAELNVTRTDIDSSVGSIAPLKDITVLPGTSEPITHSIREEGRTGPDRNLVDIDDPDDLIQGDQEVVSWPLQGADEDPRELLREQLRRSESVRPQSSRGRARTESYKSIKSVFPERYPDINAASETRPAPGERDESHENGSLESAPKVASRRRPGGRPRRYFVLTSAGKPVFASQPNRRNRRKRDAERRPEEVDQDKEEAPLYTREDDEEDPEETLTSLVGVIQAIISLYAVDNDMIRYIDAGDLKISFYLKAPMYLVAVSDLGEPESLLRTHLEYLHLAILSITTQSSITSIFMDRSNFDLRRLLAGTENILNGLLERLQETSCGGDFLFQAVSGALQVVPFLAATEQSAKRLDNSASAHGQMIETLRDECTKALRPRKSHEGILYALLVSHSSLVTLLRPKDHSIHPADLHILLTTVSSTDALRTPKSESWIPICLSRFNSRGFLHAFISYFDDEGAEESKGDDLGLGIILLTTDKEGFFDMKAWKDQIVDNMLRVPGTAGSSVISSPRLTLYKRLQRTIATQSELGANSASSAHHEKPRSGVSEVNAKTDTCIPHIQPIRHFWYKSKTHVQTFTPCVQPTAESVIGDKNYLDSGTPDDHRIRAQYLHVREALHNSVNRARGDGAARLLYIANSEEAILGLSTTSYELYACLPPQVPKTVATEAAHALARWIRKNETRIFLTNAASF